MGEEFLNVEVLESYPILKYVYNSQSMIPNGLRTLLKLSITKLRHRRKNTEILNKYMNENTSINNKK